jgi:hypothetical protein
VLGLPAALLWLSLAAPPGAIDAAGDASPSAIGAVMPPEVPPGMGEALALAPPGLATQPRGRSLLGAEPLPKGGFGIFAGAGFPYLTAEALYGVASAVGLYARLDSLYTEMEEVTLGAKWTVLRNPQGDALALCFEASQTFFEYSEAEEIDAQTDPSAGPAPFTARWLTGQRNEALAATLLLSTRYSSGITLAFAATFQLTADTEPPPGPPLSGVPPPFTVGLNTPLHLQLEVPTGRRSNFVATIGADLHFRELTERSDSIAIPFLLLGFDGLVF